jgi:hypothetical protein
MFDEALANGVRRHPIRSFGAHRASIGSAGVCGKITPANVAFVKNLLLATWRTSAMVKGFGRRPLARGGARHGEAGVRKPPKEETAFRKRRWRRSHDLWGFEDRNLLAARS